VSARLRQLLPEPGDTTVAELLSGYEPWEDPPRERPHTAVNFVATVDGRATLDGRTKELGSDADTEMLQLLRTRFDAVMVGAGTIRAERYGRMVSDPQLRARRERVGLPHDPLAVIVSGRLDLPWDAPIFTNGGGRILIFTATEAEPPETETPLRVVRHEEFVDPVEMMRYLRQERGIRALLCEGGPGLHGELQGAGLVDELFLTVAPLLTGTDALRILEGELLEPADLELAWLLEADDELFCRYRRRSANLR
jgi:riboflavin-specific deaminase-like protein